MELSGKPGRSAYFGIIRFFRSIWDPFMGKEKVNMYFER
jgi:hypothetical protein